MGEMEGYSKSIRPEIGVRIMGKRSLSELFAAIFHEKYEFSEFISLDVNSSFRLSEWKGRSLVIPSHRLKQYQSFLCAVIFDDLPVNERVSFAYRRGFSAVDAVKPHSSSKFFYKTDIEDFFWSIRSEMVCRLLREVETIVSDLELYLPRIMQIISVDGRLPIGYVSSPPISNAVLKRFDDIVEDRCKSESLTYTRYADDIILSGGRSEVVGLANNIVKEALFDCFGANFRLRKSKTKIMNLAEKVKILGLVVLPNGAITVDKQVRSKVEYLLYFYIKDRRRLYELFGEDVDAGLAQLAGLIGHINSADPSYLDKLRRKFGTTVVDSFLHKSFK